MQGLNRSTGRDVGIYPEIKEPEWHRRHGIDLAHSSLAELAAFGYSRARDAAFVQCFDAAELERVKDELGCELKLIQLVGPEPGIRGVADGSGAALASQRYAYGLGPHYSQLVEQEPPVGRRSSRR